jgi:uroporphyrinogen decarboxylase
MWGGSVRKNIYERRGFLDMNSRQRILAALSNEQPDRVPILEVIDDPVIAAIAKILGFDTDKRGTEWEILDRYCLFIKELGLDATVSGFSQSTEPIANGLLRNRYGMVFRPSAHGEAMLVDGPIREPADLVGYHLPMPSLDDFDALQYTMETVGSDTAHFLSVGDPFKTSWFLRGSMEKLMLDYVLHPGLVHDLARMGTDLSLGVIEIGAQLGVDGMFMGGDLAGNQTTLMSPRHYREYIKPYHRELVNSAHEKGLKFIKHTDGNLWPILDDFVEVGFDAFHPVQPQCMDIVEVKQYLAGKMCIIGNIDCMELLPSGTEEEVEIAVKETIEAVAGGGGYILCSSNSIHPGVKPENYIAMVRAGHKYGVYQ